MTAARQVNLKLRIRDPLRDALRKAAAERGVSMNAEMNRRLEQSFGDTEQLRLLREIRDGPPLSDALINAARAVVDDRFRPGSSYEDHMQRVGELADVLMAEGK